MKDGRLHLRLDKQLLAKAREVAAAKGTTLSAVVTSHLSAFVDMYALDKQMRELLDSQETETTTPVVVDAEQI